MTLADLLLGPAPEGASEELVWHRGEATGRTEVQERALQVRDTLRDAGVRPGDLVASVVPTSPEAIAVMFAVWAAGGTLVPLNPRLTETETGGLLDEVRAGFVVGRGGSVRRRHASGVSAPVDPDVALVLYTSGTTARPKPVLLQHSRILAGLDAVLGSIAAGRRDAVADGARRVAKPRMPNLIPFSLSLWSGIYNVCFALRVGSAVVLMDRFTPRDFADLVRRFQIRSSVLAPAMLAMLVDDQAVTDLGPLRFVRNATAPLPVPQARRFFAKFGVPVLNGYGQTELGGEVVGWNASDIDAFGATKLGAVGRPHPGIEVRVLDDDGNAVPDGEVGEVCVRSPYQMAGYLTTVDDGDAESAGNDVRLTAEGLLRTGDLGSVDGDGFLWLTGRRSDVINRSGLKVFPNEVEDVLREHEAVRDVAVAGMPDDRVGEVPWAFVMVCERAEAGESLAEALDACCRERLAPYKVPARFVFVDDLPRNDVGKVLRRVLQAGARR